MVGAGEEKDVLLVMSNNKSNASRWNFYKMQQCPNSGIGFGVQLKRGRKVQVLKSVKERKRKIKMPKIQAACCCASNCNCKCVKCTCQKKIAAAGNAEVIRARKRGRKKKEKSNEPNGPNLVSQLTELVNANRKRANQKKKQENEQKPAGESKESKPAEAKPKPAARTASAESMSNNSRLQLNNLDPNHGNPVSDASRFRELRRYSRKRKREQYLYPSRFAHDTPKPRGGKHQAKKRRLQSNAVPPSSSSGSANTALARIRRLRKLARNKNMNPKHYKKPPQ